MAPSKTKFTDFILLRETKHLPIQYVLFRSFNINKQYYKKSFFFFTESFIIKLENISEREKLN